MSKAKSRLTNFSKKISQNIESEQQSFHLKKLGISQTSNNKLKFSNFFISLPFYFLSYYIITNFYPNQVKDILIFNSYLPLLFAFFFANLFFFGFLTYRLRRGFLIAFLIMIIMFLKLQQVSYSFWLIAKLSLILLFVEFLFMYLQKIRLKK